MLTAEEYSASRAVVTNAETERSALEQSIRDSIEKAREYNDLTKTIRNRITALDRQLAPVRAQLTEYEVEQKRLLADKQRADAEAARKKATEAKAKERSELDAVKAENEKLKAELAAKG